MPGALRMVQRNALVYRRVWRGTLFSNFLQPTLFLAAFGVGLGSLVSAAGTGLPGDVTYLQFVAPGLLAAATMQAASFESSYPVLNKMVWHLNYQAISATPMRVVDIVLGELAWVTLRQLVVASAFMVVLTIAGIPRSPLALLAVPAAALVGAAFSAPVLALAGTLDRAGNFNVLYRFGLTPLFLFSGIFFPLDRVPAWAHTLAWFTPLFHGVELARGLVLGTLASPAWIVHVAYLAAMTVAGTLLAIWTFRRKLSA